MRTEQNLGRKVEEFNWTPRPVSLKGSKMAKKQPKVEGEHVEHQAEAQPQSNGEAPAEKAAPAISRGPKGVPETAVITVKASTNPKRVGSRAHKLWTLYQDGMTVKDYVEACIAAGISDQATPALVYDSRHDFISIDGYNPAVIVPKPKKEKKAKEPKVATGDAPIKGDIPTETVAA